METKVFRDRKIKGRRKNENPPRYRKTTRWKGGKGRLR